MARCGNCGKIKPPFITGNWEKCRWRGLEFWICPECNSRSLPSNEYFDEMVKKIFHVAEYSRPTRDAEIKSLGYQIFKAGNGPILGLTTMEIVLGLISNDDKHLYYEVTAIWKDIWKEILTPGPVRKL